MSRNPVNSVLNEIKKIDVEVYDRINAFSPNIEFKDAWEIQKILESPKKGKIEKLRNLESKAHDYNISHLMSALYATQEIVDDGNPVGILIGDDLETGKYLETDEETVKIMRTLIRLTVSKNQEIYEAFTDAFSQLLSLGIQSGQATKITKERIIEKFSEKVERNYLQTQIAKSIVALLEV